MTMQRSAARAALAAQNFLDAGVQASRNNDSLQAIAFFEEAGAAAPDWALPHFLIGSERTALGEWDKAEASLANAVLLDPQLHLARYQLGLLQLSGGRSAVALTTWRPLLDAAREPWMADFVRGFAALTHNDFTEASACFDRGLARPDVNPAVASDVRQVIMSMAHDHRVPAFPAAKPFAHESQSHVLVTNYGKFTLH